MSFASLERALSEWDGRTVATLEVLFDRFAERSGFADAVVELALRRELEVAATWLLDRHLDSGGVLTPKSTDALFGHLAAFESWQARIHVLQSLPHLRIREDHAPAVEAFLRDGIASPRPFVRAWSYSGFCELAKQYDEYAAEAERLLEQAASDDAASVRARVRQIEKARAKRTRR